MKTKHQKAADDHEASVREQLALVYGELGTRVQPGSGNQALKPGDVIAGDWIVECKTTAADSIAVQGKWLRKVRSEAFLGAKRCALSIRLHNKDSNTFYVIEADEFIRLLQIEREHEALLTDGAAV